VSFIKKASVNDGNRWGKRRGGRDSTVLGEGGTESEIHGRARKGTVGKLFFGERKKER